MRQIILAVLGAALFAMLAAAPAHAQATRTWVSGVGDDANPCSRTAPCKTFAGAISKTATNGEINCLDPAGYGTVTIDKSTTIDCTGTFGSILASATIGVNINMSANTRDTIRTVRLRGLSINGTGTTIGTIGIRIIDAKTVHIENSEIASFSGSGISDLRTTGQTRLLVKNTVIRDGTGPGITASATNTGIVVLDNVQSVYNTYGIAVGASNNVVASNSVFSGNTSVGAEVDAGGKLNIVSSVVSHSNVGVQGFGAAFISNSTISFNNSAINGTVTTFGNNQLVGNGALGGTLTPAGAASGDLGQQ